MRKAIYTVKIQDDTNVEQILNEIDNCFLKIEKKYTNVHVST